jgi:hypothetical protein
MADRVAEWVASYPDQFYWQIDSLLRTRSEEASMPTVVGRRRHVAE